MAEKPMEDSSRESEGSPYNMRTRRLNINLNEHLHRKLKVKAAREGKTMSDIVIELIKGYVENF